MHTYHWLNGFLMNNSEISSTEKVIFVCMAECVCGSVICTCV